MNPLQDLTEAYFAAGAALRAGAPARARLAARQILMDLARGDVPDRLRCAAAGTIVSLCPAAIGDAPARQSPANVVRLAAGRPPRADEEGLAPCDV